jgi:acyl-coenzyme A thioesterase PaaI-like protein
VDTPRPHPRRRHLLAEFGFSSRLVGAELHGTGAIAPAMHVPGTSLLRTSILATWADMVGGTLTMRAIAPRAPVTLELDVHLYRPAPSEGRVRAVGRVAKSGRSVTVIEVDFLDERGEAFAFSGSSFMAAPDSSITLRWPASIDQPPREPTMTLPLADRAGCKRQQPGIAVLPRIEDGLNGVGTIHGGLLALAAEEAVLSLAPGETLSSLGLRYLQPVRVGPAVATATISGGLGRVELRDSGRQDRLAVTATARTFGALLWPAHAFDQVLPGLPDPLLGFVGVGELAG